MVDWDNVAVSALQKDLKICPSKLLQVWFEPAIAFKKRAAACAVMAERSEERWNLIHAGWEVRSIDRAITTNVDDWVFKESIDWVTRRYECDTFVLGTGDGDLALRICEAIHRLRPAIRLFVFGVPGSISQQIAKSDLIEKVIPLGRDVMHKSGQSEPFSSASGRAA